MSSSGSEWLTPSAINVQPTTATAIVVQRRRSIEPRQSPLSALRLSPRTVVFQARRVGCVRAVCRSGAPPRFLWLAGRWLRGLDHPVRVRRARRAVRSRRACVPEPSAHHPERTRVQSLSSTSLLCVDCAHALSEGLRPSGARTFSEWSRCAPRAGRERAAGTRIHPWIVAVHDKVSGERSQTQTSGSQRSIACETMANGRS